MSDLTEALTITPREDGSWVADADPRYESLNGMFGGWTAAILLQAVMENPSRAGMPSALTVNYCGRVDAGTEVIVRTRQVGGGRSLQHWQAEVVASDGQTMLAHSMLVMANRRETDGLTELSMPEVPEPDSLDVFHPPGPQGERIVHRPISGNPPFGRNETSSMAWVQETTGRSVDHIQLAFLADSYAPRPLFWSEGPRLTATMTLSVYFHATDEEVQTVGDDYVLNRAIGTSGAMSTCGQQAQLWSRQGALLVTTEQLCWYR